jgi:hypothetical protein
VLEQDDPDCRRFRFRLEFPRANLRQLKSRHDVGHNHHLVAVDFPDARFAVVGVGNGEQCIRVRVIDKFVRNDRMQNRLDGRGRGAGARDLRGEFIHHLRIRQRLELGQF